jgi:tRNA pseudouridine55 synthase
MDFIAGEILYFNKPLTWTSFDLVNKFRYKLSRKLKVKKIKVGHAGTLDPLATGVMIVNARFSSPSIPNKAEPIAK